MSDTRFQPGQTGNPNGRPKRPIEERYLKKLSTSVKLSDWEDIIKRAVYDARKGDARARQWLSDYLLGKPTQRQEISGPNGANLVINLSWDEDDGN